MAQDIMEEQDIVYDRTMTVEEAIEILNFAELYGPVYEAKRVIIKALSEQSLKHAHWIYHREEGPFFFSQYYSCSNCDCKVGLKQPSYCEGCGAIMDEET